MHAQPRILLVDDDPPTVELYRDVLAYRLPARVQIRTATSGPGGLAMLDAEPFDLLITGLKMPIMDGLEMLSIVRTKYPQLRTMILTACGDVVYRSRAYALGVHLFLNKPTTEEQTDLFVGAVERLLEWQAPVRPLDLPREAAQPSLFACLDPNRPTLESNSRLGPIILSAGCWVAAIGVWVWLVGWGEWLVGAWRLLRALFHCCGRSRWGVRVLLLFG